MTTSRRRDMSSLKDTDLESRPLLGRDGESSDGEWAETPDEKNSWIFTGVQVGVGCVGQFLHSLLNCVCRC